MTEQEQLRRIKIITKYILDDIVRICDENGIKYYLAYGTLLGAVRHKGFIPWDDDVDIWMFRKDYDRFAEIAQSELKEGLSFHNFFVDGYFPAACSKVKMDNTYSGNNSLVKGENEGIFVDIFPLDYLPDSIKEAGKNNKRCSTLNTIFVTSFLNTKRKRGFKYDLAIKAIQLFSSKKLTAKLLVNRMTRYNKSKSTHIGFQSDALEYFDIDMFGEGEKLSFEGTYYNAPEKYDTVLSLYYGDYMKLPPENERHHHFTKADFGDFFEKHGDLL